MRAEEIDRIKWRGPRPLSVGDALRGRDAELRTLVEKAPNFDVLEITAPSGYGKSSFIAAGLTRELELLGARVYPHRLGWSWADVLTRYDEQAAGPADGELLYRLCLGWPVAEDPRSLSERFDELRRTGRPVVVLDQFEEVIRYRKRLGEALLRFIGRTATRLRITHIVAARSEYRDQLRPMEAECDSFFHLSLAEIDGEQAVDEIIRAPLEGTGITIELKAVALLRGWWLASRQGAGAPAAGTVVGRPDVGLLHLQGTLWLFKQWLLAQAPDGSEISVDDVERFATAYVHAADDLAGPRLYDRALVEYVDAQCADMHLPDPSGHWSQGAASGRRAWGNGPRLMMARSAHLFSVLGYKVAQSRSGMFQTVLAEDLEPSVARAVPLAAARAGNDLATTAAQIVEVHGAEAVKGKGLAVGWPSELVLHELLAAAVHAWEAVAGEANILRRFVQQGDDVYELVHDGMGHALQEWAAEELLKPRSLVGVITPRTGKSFSLTLEPATFLSPGKEITSPDWDGIVTEVEDGNVTEVEDGSGQVRISGIGWDASVITSEFRDVVLEGWTVTGALFLHSPEDPEVRMRNIVFRHCDLKGALFRNVKMDNVRFESCTLHGAAFRDCTMSKVKFLHPDDDDFSSLNLLSFVHCTASGEGVSLLAEGQTIGVVFDGVDGGPWAIEGKRVQHMALHAGGDASFQIGPGSYEHITVQPADLEVSVDERALLRHSDIRQPSATNP
jgi:uncharacterized protein YjbI with pentapeptide repeats